jgi:quercetin dioxygenase-like cupin family protein
LLVTTGFGQDPLKLLPDAYKLEFENDWVKVVRVHYAPHQNLPAHAHNPLPAAYVYLNDGGPVIFKHIDLPYGAITRPATKAGSFRVYKGIREIHEVQNTSELPSDFLRVEFKTDPVNEKSLKGRYYREDYPVGANFEKVQFENEQIRVTRLVCPAGKTLDLISAATEPALLIALSSSRLKVRSGKDRSTTVGLVIGQTKWIAENSTHSLENVGKSAAELLRFDFKTRVLSTEQLERHLQPHQHPKN